MTKHRSVRIALWAIGLTTALLLIIVTICNVAVVTNAEGRIFSDVETIPHNKAGLLLGTSPITRAGVHNFYFDYRIEAADALYKAGKIDYIIVSGGDYTSSNGYDEPAVMRDSLMLRGVPADKIIQDYDGTRTLNSIVKAKDVYGLENVTIISQEYHNLRTLYQADHFGINAVAYNAREPRILTSRIKNHLREYLARTKLFIDLLTGTRPKFEDKP